MCDREARFADHRLVSVVVLLVERLQVTPVDDSETSILDVCNLERDPVGQSLDHPGGVIERVGELGVGLLDFCGGSFALGPFVLL